jgi:hypothetical protein
MKLKTTELQGEALDWAVANCEGELSQHGGQVHLVESKVRFYEDTLDIQYTPSTDWSQGGPIIERERIATWFEHYEDEDAGLPCWFAAKYCEREYPGPTPLIAAMRCYVASKLGDEVEVPDEIL